LLSGNRVLDHKPSLNVRLYGTEEAPSAVRRIVTGPLYLGIQSGTLRHVFYGGSEAIRGIAFVVRDENWGTYAPRISDLRVVENDSAFRVSYKAACGSGDQPLSYSATIEGSADGSVEFAVTGSAHAHFLTNRAGFVVLHPVDGVAGASVTVTHANGSRTRSSFPELISPSQPFFDVRALRYQASPGTVVTCTMEGDTFETEDQRNWSDASYKTYIRPLSRPHPYVLEAGKEFSQRVVLGFEGDSPANARVTDRAISVTAGEEHAGRMPDLALSVHPDYADAALRAAGTISRSGVRYLFCSFDASAGHGSGTMQAFRGIGEKTGARLVLEAVLPLHDDRGRFTDVPDVLEKDVAAIRTAANDAGVDFAIVSVSPACYRKSFQPVDDWPSAPPLRAVYETTRQAFPGAAIAGGMHSYFTEFNRFPPPADSVDVVTHTTCPIVHAADDESVMETLQALPWIFRSVHALSGGKPYWVGPTAIGMRMNPYGAAPAPNPDNKRVAMAEMDPRQRGLFNAAWTLGYVARAAAGGVSGLCLSAAAGPSGIAWHAANWSQPWFDEQASETAVYPVYPVIAGLSASAGAAVRPVRCSDPGRLAALAIDSTVGSELWLANLTPELRVVDLRGFEPSRVIERLDAETFELCCSGPDGFSATARASNTSTLTLDAYAVLRLTDSS